MCTRPNLHEQIKLPVFAQIYLELYHTDPESEQIKTDYLLVM